jgi:excisionase family DNA binding protein
MESSRVNDVTLKLPEDVVEAIAQRAAAIVLDQLREESRRPSTASPYVTISEAAELLRCKRQRIDDLLSSRRLTRIKDGSRTLIARDEIQHYLRHDAR